jgi:hypothetical protein
MRIKIKNKGFTIIQLIAAIFLFGVAALLAANILFFAVTNSRQLSAKNEALHEAQISLEFIVTQIRLSNAYRITTRNSGNLRDLGLYSVINTPYEHNYLIQYQEGSRRLDFGGRNINMPEVNEYASNIDVCKIHIVEDLAYITVAATVDGQSVELSTAVCLKYKEKR